MSNQMKTIKGTAFWAHLQKPNTRFTPRWCVDLILDPEGVKQLEEDGINVREDDRGLFVTFKRNTETAKGKPQNQPVILDAKKNKYTGDIGNGSTIKVQYRPFNWTFGGKSGVGADLVAVQVLDLVEFGGEDKIVLEEEDGFETSIEEEIVNEELFDDE